MRNTLSIILFFSFFCSFSQQKQRVTVEWKEASSFYVDSVAYLLPKFQEESYDFNSAARVLQFVKMFPSAAKADEKSLAVTNLVLEDLTRSDLKDLNFNNLPTSINAVLKNSIARDT